VKNARNDLPLSVACATNESCAWVASAMSVQVDPSRLTCHCTLGEPVAGAVNTVTTSGFTVSDIGASVTTGETDPGADCAMRKTIGSDASSTVWDRV